jgi:hypothetical protein
MSIAAMPSENYIWITEHCSSLIHFINVATTLNVSSYYHSQTEDENHLFSNEGGYVVFTYPNPFGTGLINFELPKLTCPGFSLSPCM